MVPTCEGFVFLLQKNDILSLAASFALNQDIILKKPFSECEDLEMGLAHQILETTKTANRVVVTWLYSSLSVTNLYITLFEWRNETWSMASTATGWPSHETVRNFVHLPDRNTIVFNWRSDSLNLVYYIFDSIRNTYGFQWKMNESRIPGLAWNIPVHSFVIWKRKILVCVPKHHKSEYQLFDVERAVEVKTVAGSVRYAYGLSDKLPWWGPKTFARRTCDIFHGGLIRLNQARTKIIYHDSEGRCVYEFPLPSISFTRENSIKIILGGLRLCIIKSDQATLLISGKPSF